MSFRRARLTPKGAGSLEGGGCWERNCGAALLWSWGRGANKEEMFGQGSSPACGVCVRFRSRLAAGGMFSPGSRVWDSFHVGCGVLQSQGSV